MDVFSYKITYANPAPISAYIPAKIPDKPLKDINREDLCIISLIAAMSFMYFSFSMIKVL